MDIVYLPDIEGIKSPEGDIEISIFDFVYEDIAKASIPGIWLLISLVAVFTYLLYLAQYLFIVVSHIGK